MFSGDAPGSPQGLSLNGPAVAAFSAGPAPGFTTASISAGQPAQYQLQLAPNSGFAGTVWLSCSGALSAQFARCPPVFRWPVAPQHSLSASPRAVQLNCRRPPLRILPISRVPQVPLFAPIVLTLLFFLFTILGKNRRTPQLAALKNRLVLCAVLSAAIFCITFAFAGCNGPAAPIAAHSDHPHRQVAHH
jgi:hypothetical protein